jgi:hypothetical protein
MDRSHWWRGVQCYHTRHAAIRIAFHYAMKEQQPWSLV